MQYLESAGARVVPIMYDAPLENITVLFGQLNGVLFAGGSVDIVQNNTYTNAAFHIWNLAIQANDQGDVFPLWVCCSFFSFVFLRLLWFVSRAPALDSSF